MKKIYIIAAAVMTALVAGSCDGNEKLYGPNDKGGNKGLLQVQLQNNAKVDVITRAEESTDNGSKLGVFDPEEVNVQNYTLNIKKDGSNVKTGKLSELGANNGSLTEKLEPGTYNVEAYNYDGSNVNVSTRPYFWGGATATILPGKVTQANVTCKLQNIEVKVVPAQSFLDAFLDDYSVVVNTGDAAQAFNKDNISQKYYYKVPDNGHSITVSVKATTKETNRLIQKTYTVTKPENADGSNQLEKGDAFLINLKEDGSKLSYIDFGITVDFSFAEQDETFEIPLEKITYDESGNTEDPDDPVVTDPVTFTGLPADYTDPSSNGQDVIVKMEVPAGIKNLFVTITSDNAGFAGTIEGLGLAETFDMANPGDLIDVLTGTLESGNGIGLLREGEVILGKKTYTFDVTEFMGLLPLYGPGVHTFHIKVVDANDKSNEGDLVVTITQ